MSKVQNSTTWETINHNSKMIAIMEIAHTLGVKEGEVKLTPYSPLWQRCFEAEKELLERVLAPYVRQIRHIGSTAIPNIYAKPIIDIMVGFNDLQDRVHVMEVLETIGYRYEGEQEIPGWHFFTKANEAQAITHHLHLVAWGSKYWYDHLLFQWYLCQHPEVAEAYEKLKLDLAAKYPTNRKAYTRDKSDFILKVTEMAWRAHRYGQDADADGNPPITTRRKQDGVHTKPSTGAQRSPSAEL